MPPASTRTKYQRFSIFDIYVVALASGGKLCLKINAIKRLFLKCNLAVGCAAI